MAVDEYRIELDVYSGPLDLLLYLVRRQEIDIYLVRLAEITDQFLEFLDVLEVLDLDLAGDFAVTASTLLEIKSRLALPQQEDDDDEVTEDECNSELVRKLLEYKQYRDSAAALSDHAASWQERYPRLSNDRPRQGRDPASDRIREVELWDLVSALSRILKRPDVKIERTIRYDERTIGAWQDRIRERIAEHGHVAFSAFFEGEDLRSRIVGIFLAILELIRHHGYRADQPVEFGEIRILPPLEETVAEGEA